MRVSVLDRVGRVVKAEWTHRFRRGAAAASAPAPGATARQPVVVDVAGALRVLELAGTPSLADVRARYRELAVRYHPKTQSPIATEADAARVVLDALTDALEVLEEHLLPA